MDTLPDVPLKLEGLFAGHQSLPGVLGAALENRLGRVHVDRAETPSVARIDVGCYAFFGGDAAHASALDLLVSVAPPRELIYPDAAWRRRMLEVFGERLGDRPMDSFSGQDLRKETLEAQAAALPAGYGLEALNREHLPQLDAGLQPHGLQSHDSPESFLRRGGGWGILSSSGALASVATAYARSSSHVEVAISTRAEHRGRGLATSVAARFCLEAVRAGLLCCWNASNPVSKRLARRLGFVPNGVCEVLYLAE